ncbi:HAD family hydrolase [Streptomyces sp. RKND-216]|uniref:HAD family hydrolase n=1 Tax=Streptomyces sp. RKND-216 TaxID=2562581 RepID=UPI00109E09CE|nr:HAD family hydrolase [Streptomyces sp. RKND-216]THA25980.1 HAD family hydrolase [Streptomyces sp. RKND-216]
MADLFVTGPEGPIRPRGAEPVEPVRAVLFDFSGTLFQMAPYPDRVRAALGRPVGEAEMDRILGGLEAGLADPDVAAAQHGRDVSAPAHRHAFTTWYGSAPELAPVAGALYDQLRTPEHWVPYTDTRETLGALAAAGIGVGVVSDVGWDLRPTFAHHGLDDPVGAWVHSCDHGTEKPDPVLFRHACDVLGVTPGQALMVGDVPAKDGGAAAAGIRSYVLPAGQVPGSRRGLDAVLRLAGVPGSAGRRGGVRAPSRSSGSRRGSGSDRTS